LERRCRARDPETRRRAWPALPFIAMRLQLSALYFFSGLFKLEGAPWRDGTALNGILQDTLFSASPAGLFFVAQFPVLPIAVNYLVIAFQLSFPYLIYSPWRNELTRGIALIGSAAMHLSFIVFLSIGGFPYLCLIMLILLVPDAGSNSCCAAGASRPISSARLSPARRCDGFCRFIAISRRAVSCWRYAAR
jgi:hypothetical protein